MHQPAIVVGTVDSLVSKALNRGYGIGRAIYPIDFALVTNGAQWIIDEIQLCPESTTTLRQLAGFTRGSGTAEPFGLDLHVRHGPAAAAGDRRQPRGARAWSAILPGSAPASSAVRLEAAPRGPAAGAPIPGNYKAIAAAVRGPAPARDADACRAEHGGRRPAGVQAAHAAARAECMLLHSRFRGTERAAADGGAGRAARRTAIVVSTQVWRPGST